jgi:hypothetical protein
MRSNLTDTKFFEWYYEELLMILDLWSSVRLSNGPLTDKLYTIPLCYLVIPFVA